MTQHLVHSNIVKRKRYSPFIPFYIQMMMMVNGTPTNTLLCIKSWVYCLFIFIWLFTTSNNNNSNDHRSEQSYGINCWHYSQFFFNIEIGLMWIEWWNITIQYSWIFQWVIVKVRDGLLWIERKRSPKKKRTESLKRNGIMHLKFYNMQFNKLKSKKMCVFFSLEKIKCKCQPIKTEDSIQIQ